MKKPKIRFNGFNDDWEQRKLGDITESYSGGTPTAGKKNIMMAIFHSFVLVK